MSIGTACTDLYVTTARRARGTGCTAPRERHVRGRSGEAGSGGPQTARRTACRWALSGATTTTTVRRLSSDRWGRQALFHNDRGQGFTAVTTAALPDWANVNTAVWLDFDRDGRLDLFVGGYYPESVNLWKLADTRMMPESFEYANNGGRKYLFRNLGGGTFEEVSEKAGLASRRWALAAVAADLRGTGYPDLFIANDYGVSEFSPTNTGGFARVGRDRRVGYAPRAENAIVGDVANQALRDLRVNISEEGFCCRATTLVPSGSSTGSPDTRILRARWAWISEVEFRCAVRRSEQRRLSRPLPRQRLRVSVDRESYWYDFSKIGAGKSNGDLGRANGPGMGTGAWRLPA